ncbi:MAG: hypothetical protein P9M15_04215, partial [Candidatus Electryoneaceae bacterium]|nr:hypothetical protein [Candidatus Electryoneaceae bacterium]
LSCQARRHDSGDICIVGQTRRRESNIYNITVLDSGFRQNDRWVYPTLQLDRTVPQGYFKSLAENWQTSRIIRFAAFASTQTPPN